MRQLFNPWIQGPETHVEKKRRKQGKKFQTHQYNSSEVGSASTSLSSSAGIHLVRVPDSQGAPPSVMALPVSKAGVKGSQLTEPLATLHLYLGESSSAKQPLRPLLTAYSPLRPIGLDLERGRQLLRDVAETRGVVERRDEEERGVLVLNTGIQANREGCERWRRDHGSQRYSMTAPISAARTIAHPGAKRKQSTHHLIAAKSIMPTTNGWQLRNPLYKCEVRFLSR